VLHICRMFPQAAFLMALRLVQKMPVHETWLDFLRAKHRSDRGTPSGKTLIHSDSSLLPLSCRELKDTRRRLPVAPVR